MCLPGLQGLGKRAYVRTSTPRTTLVRSGRYVLPLPRPTIVVGSVALKNTQRTTCSLLSSVIRGGYRAPHHLIGRVLIMLTASWTSSSSSKRSGRHKGGGCP